MSWIIYIAIYLIFELIVIVGALVLASFCVSKFADEKIKKDEPEHR
jgi:hypothetical protein